MEDPCKCIVSPGGGTEVQTTRTQVPVACHGSIDALDAMALGAAPIMGLLSMGEDGRIDLGSPKMDRPSPLPATSPPCKERMT